MNWAERRAMIVETTRQVILRHFAPRIPRPLPMNDNEPAR